MNSGRNFTNCFWLVWHTHSLTLYLQLVLNEPELFGDMSAIDLVFWSALACKQGAEGQGRDAIDTVIIDAVTVPGPFFSGADAMKEYVPCTLTRCLPSSF